MTKISEDYLIQRGFDKINSVEKAGVDEYRLLIGKKIEILYFFKVSFPAGRHDCYLNFIGSEKMGGYDYPIDTEEQMEKVIQDVEQMIKQ